MGRTACTEPQGLYKGALYLFLTDEIFRKYVSVGERQISKVR